MASLKDPVILIVLVLIALCAIVYLINHLSVA